MTPDVLSEFLIEKSHHYNQQFFIEHDPISIVHKFTKKEDIEIVGLLMSIVAWGNRKSIISYGEKLIELMGNQPYSYVLSFDEELADINFVHRTFNEVDLAYFLKALSHIYQEKGLEATFEGSSMIERISNFRNKILSYDPPKRTLKHISNPLKGSSCKRINMFLRWMCRKDNKGVDFGIWNSIPIEELLIPLDVHTGNISRKLQLLQRKQNDWKALMELMENVRKIESKDPARIDFALFGLGAFEKF